MIPPTSIELILFFVAGLLGGAHCLGMCGPLVSIYSDRMDTPAGTVTWFAVRQHLLFGLGRSISYGLVGGLLGVAGRTIQSLGTLLGVFHGLRGIMGLLVGMFIGLIGFSYLIRGTPLGGTYSDWIPGELNPVPFLMARVESWVNGTRIAALGSLHALLPCPILYPAFAYCLARTGPVSGTLLMSVLGAGTIPTLFVYGLVHQSVPASIRGGMHRVLGCVFGVLGLVTVSMALRQYGIELPVPMFPYTSPLS